MPDRPKIIQEQFGEKVIEAFAEFARADLEQPKELEKSTFSHVRDPELRLDLAQVFYGARWIYKVGLALLTRDEERAAHVRAQIVDYAAVCEALLSYCIAYAMRQGHVVGSDYEFDDLNRQTKPIRWNLKSPELQLAKRSLWWLARVSKDFGVIDGTLEAEVQWLREQRNTVHLRARASLGPTAYLNQSKRAFKATTETIHQTRVWCVDKSSAA